ncbi:hypothetical protein ACFLUK_02430, partial [Chloroflexota bacterium]
EFKMLMEHFRLGEAIELAIQISDNLSQANGELKRIEQATVTTGGELQVLSAPAGSNLRRSYNELLERIERIREMLDLYQELLESTGLTMEELLESTGLTMEVQPRVAFVGDNIRFEGVLVSKGEPLFGREVDILLNGSRYVSVRTDTYGRYQGILQVPYWYIPEMDLQALYYPRDKDIGTYLASLSPVTKVGILFYETKLEVTVDDKAYPGLETTVSGRFDYGEYPLLKERKAEIYIDDVFVNEITAQEAFTQRIEIDPEACVGRHVVTVSVAAVERYSSVVASVILNVTRAIPILDLNIPKVAVIPGSVELVGRLYSEVGPLSEAPIKMRLGKSRVEFVSSRDGTFNTRIKAGMNVGIIGSQDLAIQVLPQQPWHAPLNSASSIIIVNMINIGGILAILIFLGIYLPGRLRRRLGACTSRRVRPEMPTALPELTPVYSERVTALTVTEESKEITGEPRGRIFYRFRLIVRYLQGITKASLGPQQTLREFARETSGLLESASKYFIELTKLAEKILYSQYKPSENDVKNSKRLSNTIEEETKLRVTVQPTQPRGDEITAPFGYNAVSRASETSSFELGGRDFMASVWKQLSTWLLILLVLTILFYACILLFILPLLIVSFALCPPLVMIDDSRKGEPMQ